MKLQFLEPFKTEIVVNTDCLAGAMDVCTILFAKGEELEVSKIERGKKVKHGRLLHVWMDNPCKKYIREGSLHDNKHVDFEVPSNIVICQ